MSNKNNRNFQKMNIGNNNQQRGPPQNASPVGGASSVVVNSCPLKVQKNTPIFKYDVKIKLTFKNVDFEKELTTERFDDSRRQCAQVMAHLASKGKFDDTAYNRAAALYSLVKLGEEEFVFKTSEIPQLESELGEGNVTVTVKPAADFQTSTNDLKSCLNARADYQPNLLEAINILLEREAFSKPNEWYSMDAIHFKMDNSDRVVNMDGGVILKPGLKTSAEVVGNDVNSLRLLVTADIKSVVHHLPQMLDVKLGLLKKAGCHNPIDALLGVRVVPTYGEKRRAFQIASINASKRLTDTIEGQNVNNIQYFKQKYGVTLTKTDLPMIGKRAGSRVIWFPAEMLQIVPNQSVSKERMLASHHDQVVRFSAMLPNVRIKLCKDYMTMLGFFNSANLKKFGFAIEPDFLELPCTVIGEARINDKIPRFNTNVEKILKFHKAPTFGPWGIVNYNCTPPMFQEMQKWIVSALKDKGCQFPEPAIITVTTNPSSEELLDKAVAAKLQFIIIVLDDRLTIHDGLKYFEQQKQVVTQIITASVVRKAVERKQNITVENILLKTCLKNGGIPYGVETQNGALKIRTNDVMYMGVAFSHQQGGGGPNKKFMTMPSRIGYAATCSFHPNTILGDFKFVKPHDNEAAFEQLTEIVKQCLDNFIACRSKPNTKVVPKTIVLYLNGYSEGQWRTLEQEFIPKVKKVILTCKLIIILENKHTMVRLYKPDAYKNPTKMKGNPKEDNVQAGLCLDHSILNPMYKGFYLNPHVVLQGTARSAKYTVLLNDAGVDIKSIENATHALSFLHSVCMTPTSEPAVITIADRCALRGQTVLKFHMMYRNLQQISVEDANKDLTNPLTGRCHRFRYNA